MGNNCWQFTAEGIADKDEWMAQLHELVCEYLHIIFSLEYSGLGHYDDFERNETHRKIAEHLGVEHDSINTVFHFLNWDEFKENGHCYIYKITDLLLDLRRKGLLENKLKGE